MISIPAGGFASGQGGLLILLLAGHIFGDFLLQTQRMANLKEFRVWPLLGHGLLVFVAHLAVLAPVLTPLMATGIVGVAAFHLLTDMVRTRLCGAWAGTFAAFLSDQLLHVAALVALWLAVGWRPEWHGTGPAAAEWLPAYIRWTAIVAAFVFNARGGTAIVRKTLERYPCIVPETLEDGRDEYEMGRVIGTLERFVVLTLLIFGQWTATAIVIAAKFLARFPGFKSTRDEGPTEYYQRLIGTLTSIFVAMVSGILVKLAIG